MLARFRSPEHEDRYEEAVLELVPAGMDPTNYTVPSDWSACLFILTANERLWSAVHPHVHAVRREIDWNRIRRLTLSRGERFLIDLARLLYNGDGRPDWDSLWNTLDIENWRVAMSALAIRRLGERCMERGM